jgi:D-alanyl-D-alanine endopeptidase (penicillin-binding protein 7)
VPARPSFGQVYGLHGTADPLDLKSSVALVIDQDTNEVLFSKNSQAVLPIASLTKLMTALVVTEAKLPLDEDADDHPRRHRHRKGQPLAPDGRHAADPRRDAAPGADVVREPCGACAGRTTRAALSAFVAAMNRKALELGMTTPLRRAHGPVEPQPVERARSGHAGERGPQAPADSRVVDLA